MFSPLQSSRSVRFRLVTARVTGLTRLNLSNQHAHLEKKQSIKKTTKKCVHLTGHQYKPHYLLHNNCALHICYFNQLSISSPLFQTTSAGIMNNQTLLGAFSTGHKVPVPAPMCVQPLPQAFLFFSISRYMPRDFWMDSLVMKLTKCWMSASLPASSRSMVGFLIMDLEICLAWSEGGANPVSSSHTQKKDIVVAIKLKTLDA